jgi:hypothetical protein
MTWLILGIAILVFGMLAAIAVIGFHDGDRPGDAIVTAALTSARQPDETRPVIVAAVRNTSAVPVLVGLRVRRTLTTGTISSHVPWRTSRRRYRADDQDTVGVVPPGAPGIFRVPVRARGRCYRLVAVIGQDGRRLRVLTVPVAYTRETDRLVMREGL